MRLCPLASILLCAASCAKSTRPPTPDVRPLPADLVTRCPAVPTPQRTLFVHPEGNDGSDGLCASAQGACGPWRTARRALDQLQAGDRLELASGAYGDSLRPARSGAAGAPITIAAQPGADVTVTATLDLSGLSNIVVEGLQFESRRGDSWIQMDTSSAHITVFRNSFESFHEDFASFVGLHVAGEDLTVCGNAFGSWLGDMVSVDGASGVHLAYNDMSQSAADHMLLQIMGTRVWMHHNVLRNPWQRTMAINNRDTEHPAGNILVENNLFLHSNWDRESPIPTNGNSNFERFTSRVPGMRTDHTGGGDAMARVGGTGGIFRNNLLLGAQAGLDWPCSAALSISTYDSRDDNTNGYLANHAEQWRVYHNTFHGGARSHLSTLSEPMSDIHGGDNRFFHNVFGATGKYTFITCGDDMPWTTWALDHNVLSMEGAVFHLESREADVPAGDVTLEDAQSRAPQVFRGNVQEQVSFVDVSPMDRARGDFTQASLALHGAFVGGFVLDSASAAVDTPFLSRVLEAAADSTTLRVEDARVFSDGLGITAGDALVVAGYMVRVVAVVDATTLLVDAPVTAAVGDGVSLGAMDAQPRMGINRGLF